MILAVASGKGGTGKTTVSANLASVLAQRNARKTTVRSSAVRLLDCDVEAPNAHLFLNPEFSAEEPVVVPKPIVDSDLCTGCSACVDACRYNALALAQGSVLIFPELCHSCGVCSYVCPADAMGESKKSIGTIRIGNREDLSVIDGYLNVGEVMSPAIIRSIKKHIDPDAINILDSPPGTACTVVETITDADAVLLVTEPTPFGLHDLKLAVELTRKLALPTAILVNRSDGADTQIADFARRAGIRIAGRIPFRREFAVAYSKGKLLTEEFPELYDLLKRTFDNLAPRVPGRCDQIIPAPVHPDQSRKNSTSTQDNKSKQLSVTAECKEIAVISGKGGTGKTTVSASLCAMAKDIAISDTDVDAADLHLLLKPNVKTTHEFFGGEIAYIDYDRCTNCGICVDLCRFRAIETSLEEKKPRIAATTCEGCGLCSIACPADAIHMRKNLTGHWFESVTRFGPMVHAKLGVAEENSGRLVTEVRKRATEIAACGGYTGIIQDGPPGVGCPAIASVTRANMVVVVTEPTIAGVHDLERALRLVQNFRLPAGIVINKSDLNPEYANKIENLAEKMHVFLFGRVPFDRDVEESIIAGKPLIEYSDGPAARALRQVWRRIREQLESS